MSFGDVLKKAVYLGVGLASYAGEKAGEALTDLQVQAQQIAGEMVERGEMTTEEARRFVDDIVRQAQQVQAETTPDGKPAEPRTIEILDAEEVTEDNAQVDDMRRKVADLQAELERLRQQQS